MKADHRIEVRDGFQKKLPRGHEEKPTRDITRVFHPVGGFEAVPFYIELESGKKFWIKLREGVR